MLEVETPEHVLVRMPLAGFGSRGLAFVLDVFIIGIFSLFLILFFSLTLPMWASVMEVFTSKEGGYNILAGLVLVLVFAILWLWFAAFETRTGRTPGKKMMGLRVLTTTGKPISWREAWLRHILRFADLAPALGLVAFLSSVFSPQFQRLGDRVAGTVVIRERALWRRRPEPRLVLAPTPDEAVNMPLRVRLRPEEAEALDRFLRRAARLGEDRARELALVLAPTLSKRIGAHYTDPVRFLSLAYERYNAPLLRDGK